MSYMAKKRENCFSQIINQIVLGPAAREKLGVMDVLTVFTFFSSILTREHTTTFTDKLSIIGAWIPQLWDKDSKQAESQGYS